MATRALHQSSVSEKWSSNAAVGEDMCFSVFYVIFSGFDGSSLGYVGFMFVSWRILFVSHLSEAMLYEEGMDVAHWYKWTHDDQRPESMAVHCSAVIHD